MFNFFNKKNTDNLVMPMKVDIHCHVLPGVDDGSPDIESSLKLVERMAGLGLTRIIASPHVTQDTFENTPETLDNALVSLQNAIKETGLNIDLDRSAEYRIDEFSISQIESGIAKILPKDYILVENSFIQEPWELDKFLFNLKIKGMKPILAHPERYGYYHNDRFARYKQLHDTGTMFQVNLLSLAGAYGKKEKTVANELVNRGYVDFIGTDIHRNIHIDIIEDFLLSREYRKIREKLSIGNDIEFLQ